MSENTEKFGAAETSLMCSTLAATLMHLLKIADKPNKDTAPGNHYTQSILFDFTNGLVVVATDGHAISAHTLEIQEPDGECSGKFALPYGHAAELLHQVKGLRGIADVVKLTFTTEMCTAKLEREGREIELVMPLLDSAYPDWRKVVSDPEGEPTFKVNAGLLADAAGDAQVSVWVAADDKPLVVKQLDKPHITSVVMPVKPRG